jgi:multiple sugar transport system ATP-binding protein
MAALRIKELVKKYGAAAVLHGVDLDVADGEFVVLVGPSGCGKSTLLRMIAGLDDISSGQMWIGERLANGLSPQNRNISMVFQSYALFPHMRVADNVGFGPRIRRDAPAMIKAKVAKAAETLNLSAYLDRFPRQLSGGQRQRVAMGRTIVRTPDLFLFDEPLSNLDAKLRGQMRTEIKALHLALKTTIVYVTHDQIEAMTMADRIVVMNAGRIEQVGAPLQLYDRPVNRFVASFLGSPAMSFIPGAIERGDGAPILRTETGAALPAGLSSAASGQKVEIGIRPEHFRLCGEGEGFPLDVAVVEPTGSETHVFGAVAGAPVRAVFRDRVAIAPGASLRVSVDPVHIHVFDARDGVRL